MKDAVSERFRDFKALDVDEKYEILHDILSKGGEQSAFQARQRVGHRWIEVPFELRVC